MVRLTNVTDSRTGKHHSVVIVKERYVKYFIPDEVEPEPEVEETVEENNEEETEE